MKTKVAVGAFSIAATLIASGSALAQECKTREEVRAELVDAVRTGDVYRGDIGLKLNEMAPGRYSAKPMQPARSREQVKAELADAIRAGDVYAGDMGLKLNEISPWRYPATEASIGKSRDEVRAELAEAVRTGDIYAGEVGMKLNEISPDRYPAARFTAGAMCSPGSPVAAGSGRSPDTGSTN